MPVYDVSYRHLEGEREPGRLRFLPIASIGVRLFFRRRIYVWLGFAALVPFFLFLLGIAAPHLFETVTPSDFPEEFRAFFHLSGTSLYAYLARFEWVFIFLFALLAGAGLIADDLRANALEIYLSRPITRLDYVLGKVFVVLFVLLGMTLLPTILLWIVDVALADEEGFVARQAPLLLRAAPATLVLTLPYALLVLAASALARTRRTAMVLFAALERITAVAGFILAHALDEPRFGLFSLAACMRRLAAWMLGADVELLQKVLPGPRGVPLVDLPLWMPTAVVALVCLAAAAVLARRVCAVEVVSG